MKIKNIMGIIVALPFILWAQTTNENNITIIKPYDMHFYDRDIENAFQIVKQSESHVNARIKAASGYFLNRPYQLGSTGEGATAQFDKQPIYRTDQFDCLTYVETILALVESYNLNQFKQTILKIRYHAPEPTFLNRNHFTTIDWNPQNQRNGYIKDVTRVLFPKDYKLAIAIVDRPSWFRHLPLSTIKLFKMPSADQKQQLLNQLHHLATKTTVIKDELPYVPLTALFDTHGKPIHAMFAKIPDGSIIEIVRPNWNLKKLIGTNLNVSHLGFAIKVNHVLVYREASSVDKKVEDIPLTQYLRAYLQSATIKGIHIEKIMIAHPSASL